jgi:L-alanine-DL-glutamate epimerase-like enolase superfamily enzyme
MTLHKWLLCERFIPRLKAADSQSLLNDARDNRESARVGDVLMRNEKPAGHGQLDMAVGDVAAKIAGVPLYVLLADRIDIQVFVYAAGLGLGAANLNPASSSLSADSPRWRTPACGFPIFPELGSKLKMHCSES